VVLTTPGEKWGPTPFLARREFTRPAPRWSGVRVPLLLGLLVMSSPVLAESEPARDDIVDIRHGRMPVRAAALGWRDSGAFVYRRTACSVQDLSDIPQCSVVIDVAAGGQTRSNSLFAATWEIGCVESRDATPDPTLGCWKIPTAEASRFISAERALLATLGPLTPGTRIGPDLPAGRITVVRYEDERADRRRAAIVLANKGRWRPLAMIWSVGIGTDEFLRREPTIVHLERSPDGASLAIVTSLAHAEDDYYWDTYRVDVIPMP
jgi:hypothetical protein